MLTITIASPQYQEIYEIAKAANLIENPAVASEKLLKYSDIMVRVGGWNAPFITLPLSHMENYINRPVKSN
jgi:formate C-acetyltransferase